MCTIADADDTRETMISVLQSAILPADGTFAAAEMMGLRHIPLAARERKL
jgi:hypothetical protein